MVICKTTLIYTSGFARYFTVPNILDLAESLGFVKYVNAVAHFLLALVTKFVVFQYFFNLIYIKKNFLQNKNLCSVFSF